MTLNMDTASRIKEVLKDHPEGLSITDIVREIQINRNTASRYLDTMLVSGQVEMRHFGMAKLYSLTSRLPVSSVLSISSEYILQIDNSLRIIFINTPFLRLLELHEKDVFRKKLDYTKIPLVFGELYAQLMIWINEGLTGIECRGEIPLIASGRILSCRVTPAVLNEGQKGVSILFEDITLQRRDEVRLRESEEKFRTLVEASTNGILICDQQGLIIEWNNALSSISGIPRDTAMGARLAEILRTLNTVVAGGGIGTTEMLITRLKKAIRTGSSRYFSVPLDLEIQRPDGERRMIQQTIFPIPVEGGLRIGSIIHDVTDQRKTQEFSRVLARMSDNAPASIMIHDFEGNILYANEETFRLHGYSPREFLGKNLREIDTPESGQRIAERFREVRETGAAEFDVQHLRKDGTLIALHANIKLMDWEGRQVVLSIATDRSERDRADAALRTSEQKYRAVVENTTDAIYIHDLIGTILDVNGIACRMTGYDRSELVGANLSLIDRGWKLPVDRDREMLLQNSKNIFERENIRKDGAIVPVEVSVQILSREGAGICHAFVRDISERKRAEATLRESEQKFRMLSENARDGIFRISLPDGRYEYLSPAFLDLSGYSPEEFYADPRLLFRIIHPESQEYFREKWLMLLAGDVPPVYEFKIIHKLGETRWMNQRNRLITGPGGRPVALEGLVTDVTERKRADDHLRLLKISVDSAYDEVFWMDMDANMLYVNDAVCRATGYSREELYAMKIFSLDPDLTPQRWEASIEELRRNKRQFFQTRHRCKNGNILDIEVSSVYVTRGSEEYAFCFVRDITHRKKTEEALRASERRYRRLLEQSFDAVVIHRDGIITDINDTAARLVGSGSPADLLGRSIYEFVHPASRESVRARLARPEEKLDLLLPLARQTYIRGDGTPFEVEIMSTVFLDDGTPAVQTVFRDITDQVARERALERSEEQYRTLAESAEDMIYITDAGGRLLYANPPCARLCGCHPFELVGKELTALFPPAVAEQHTAAIAEVIRTGKPCEREGIIPVYPSGTMRIDIKFSPARYTDSKTLSVVGIARDISRLTKNADPTAGQPGQKNVD